MTEAIQNVDTTGEKNLANVAINLFTHFVVNESGKSVENMLTFIKECLLGLMTH